MHEIICPNCSKAFKIDEAGYADIQKQVRDSEFDEQLHERLKLAEKDKLNAVELAKSHASSEMQKTAAAKDAEITELKAKLEAEEVAKQLAVTEALGQLQKEKDGLASQLELAKREQLTSSELAEAKLAAELQSVSAAKDQEIAELKSVKCS